MTHEAQKVRCYPLKYKQISLHMERRRALLLMLLFTLTLFALGVFAAITTSRKSAHLSSLFFSRYDYSVTATSSLPCNSYYQFNAGISFFLFDDAEKSINADILMQSNESQYTDAVDWSADRLEVNSIAITRGLARSNGLHVGDMVLSKHVVDGALYEYTIEQILPELTSINAADGKSYSDGIIIMGSDIRYIENVSHTYIGFAEEPIEVLSESKPGPVEIIVYRSDEIAAVVIQLLPYVLLIVALSILATYGIVFLITKEVKYNFRRQVMLGFGKNDLNHAYNRLLFSIGIPAIVLSFLMSGIMAQLLTFSLVAGILLCIVLLLELLTLCFSSYAFKRQLWGI